MRGKMINLSSQYIQQSGGLLSAISLKSAEIVRDIIGDVKMNCYSGADQLDFLLTHKEPHLDEYMAILLFRASLPEQQRLVPLDEIILHSTKNDQFAKTLWPSAAVFGMGGAHNGGATPKISIDEHVKTGEKRKATSATKIVMNQLFKGRQVPMPLFKIQGEVDLIDSSGGAHAKHLANYIKKLHDTEFPIKLSSDGRTIAVADILTPTWKQALIEACIAAIMMGINERRDFTIKDYWLTPAIASLEDYKNRSLLRHNVFFERSYATIKGMIEKFFRANLQVRQTDGQRKSVLNKNGKPIPQLLIMPYLAALCQEYWGPELGHIIMAHFWEARVSANIGFNCVQDVLDKVIGDGSSEVAFQTSEAGTMCFRHYRPSQQPSGGKAVYWILEFTSRPGVNNAKAALLNFLTSRNNGQGYIILRNPSKNNMVLNKGANIKYETWSKLCDLLIAREGNSDSEPAGCWHQVDNIEGRLEGFMLNGNSAHQYVPKSSLSAEGLIDLLALLD
jgi:hypothetical protein